MSNNIIIFVDMENLWNKSHKFVITCKVGDYYQVGSEKISVVRRTPKRIYFSNGNVITIQKSKSGLFHYLGGKNVNQILRDIEGYFVYQIHDHLPNI